MKSLGGGGDIDFPGITSAAESSETVPIFKNRIFFLQRFSLVRRKKVKPVFAVFGAPPKDQLSKEQLD